MSHFLAECDRNSSIGISLLDRPSVQWRMPNLIDALKKEITRLARKETKGQITSLRAASARYRGEIAELKRVTKDFEKRLAQVEQRERKRAEKPSSPELAEGMRFSAKGLKSHRAKLGLSVADYGLLGGVGRQMMYKYEGGQTKPRKAQIAKFVAVRDLGKREARSRLALLKA